MGQYTLETVPTPALIVDEVAVDRNLARMQAYVNQHKLRLRPHTKTHKSVYMSRKQLAAGAAALTVAKVGELQTMAQAGDDLLLAYPALDPARTEVVAQVARSKTVRVAVDSQVAADRLAAAAVAAGSTIGILVDYDTGMHRTGLQTAQQTVDLAQHVSRTKGLRLDGLFCYPGHINDTDPAQMIPRLKDVNAMLLAVLEQWKRLGLNTGIVSGGSTPAAWQAHHITAYTEVRPGTYIYNDRFVAGGGWCQWEDCAATILTTVVSDAVPDQCIVDAGGKTLTYDRSAKAPVLNFGNVREIQGAFIRGLSEEHGMVDLKDAARRPKLGERVNIVMHHVCPCVNLHDRGWLKKADGSLEPLPIDARGKVV
jgi:D-serine deaminase-like pyridoxal phosphate-dependent protein